MDESRYLCKRVPVLQLYKSSIKDGNRKVLQGIYLFINPRSSRTRTFNANTRLLYVVYELQCVKHIELKLWGYTVNMAVLSYCSTYDVSFLLLMQSFEE